MMGKGKTKRILLGIMLCGCFASQAQATETYPVYTVTEQTEYVTYTGADGSEQTYAYTAKVPASTDTTFTNTYGTVTGDAAGTKYYAWTEEGFQEVDSSAADITVTYSKDGTYSESGGIYNDGSGTYIENGADITADFVEDHHGYNGGSINLGGAIENYAGVQDASLGTITGNFIGDSENASGNSFGGAIANEAANEGLTASITAINGNFIGNYLNAKTSGSAIAGGGAVCNEANGNSSVADIGAITGDFIGNFVTDDEGSGSSGIAGGAIYNRADKTGGTASIGSISGDFVGNYAVTGTVSAEGGAIYSDATAGTSVSIGDITGDFIGNYVSSSGQGAGGAVFSRAHGNNASAAIGKTEGTFTANYAKSANGSAMGGAIVNYTQRATSNDTNEKAEIKAITGDFIGNYTEGATTSYGGAIYNSAASAGSTASIGAITAKEYGFIANYAKAGSSQASGGAILNMTGSNAAGSSSTIGTVTADFINNYSLSGSGSVYGGAVFNYSANETGSAEISAFKGDFTGNYGESGESGVYGGAIANYGYLGTAKIDSIEGSFIGNYATTSGAVYGGAIYNRAGTGYTAEITSIKGDFIENYAKSTGSSASYGGAIVNYNAEISEITGSFVGNSAESTGSSAYGGAIANRSGNAKIDSITGDFIGNYAKSDTASAYGGAMLNFDGSAEIGTVTGSFTGNYAEAATTAGGGAIYNQNVTMGAVTGDFLGNYATGSTALGGAIYNIGSELTVTGAVGGNHAEGSSQAYGGAIYNTGTVNLTTTAITNNYVTGGDAKGGAIYNAAGGTVNINAESDMLISGNYAGSSDNSNVLYGEEGSVTNFKMSGSSITLMDNLDGDEGYEVNVEGDGTGSTTFYFLSDAEKSNISFNNTTLNTINDEVHVYNVNKFTVAGDFNMVADVDMANETMDRFTASEYGEHAGTLTVSGMNLISDTDKDRVGIYFAEPGLKENVASSLGSLPGSYQTTVYAPINEYSVSYDKNYDGSWGDDGGYFVFEKTGNNNPDALIPEEAEAGAIAFMGLMFEYAFEHSDYYMKLPSEVRLAIREKAKAAKAEKLAAKNGTTVEEETKKIDDARAEEMASREGVKFYDHENVLPLYDQHELTRPGVWVKPFASNESVPFKHQFTARNRDYGILVGVDTDLVEHDNGWGEVFTVYAGYDGIHQSFSGNSIRQDGGVFGLTETLYKKNFYTAWTIAGGANTVKGRSSSGREKTDLYMYGIAAKSGWNLEYDGGKYAVLPTFMVSYTYADIKDYTNAAGVKMDAKGMHAVQLNPNIKWIRNLSNGWQPYLAVGEVWTVAENSNVKANGTRLDTLTYRPYTEYGIGVQKRWANNYDGYAQFMGHAGGRRGFLATLGFRWTFN
ncbi:MAG: hypothetical protein LUD72_09905 [Bacteroidales bacterium]|nr:hypothetical protein [Bacteroidales bacterium]